MKNNHERDGEDEIQAARRTAYALGQTEGAERAEVVAELTASPQARQEVEEVEALAAQLKEAAREAPQPEPSLALREVVEKRFVELDAAAPSPSAPLPEGEGSRGARPWRGPVAALALAAASLLAFAVVVGWSTKFFAPGMPRQVAKQSPSEVGDAPVLHGGTAGADETMSSTSQQDEFEPKYDVGKIEDAPLEELDTDPTLERPGKAAQEAEYNDGSQVFEHRGGGTVNGPSAPVGGRGAMAFGPGAGPSPGPSSGTRYSGTVVPIVPPRTDYVVASGDHVVYDDRPVGLRDSRDVVVQHRDVYDDDVVVHRHRNATHAGGGYGAGGGGSGDGSGQAGADGDSDVTVVDPGSTGHVVARSSGVDPSEASALGIGTGVGTGKDWGSGGSGSGFGGRGSGSRKAMLATGGGTKHTERAVTGSLVWLANHQAPDGHWSLQHYVDRCTDKTCTGPGEIQSDTAATAMSLIPFLAAGQTHKTRGPYQDHILKGIDWLIRHQQPDGNLAKGAAEPMYSQGLATIALSEAYGLTGDRQVGQAAQRAVDFICKAQNADGGWRENPQDPGDTSLVGWQVMALKSAHMAGLNVGDKAFPDSSKWLDAVAVNHGAEYSLWPGLGSSSEATAAGLLCRQYLGAKRDDPMLTGGMDYIMHHLPDETTPNIHYWNAATQFMHNMSGYEWDVWNRKMRDVLVRTQVRDVNQCANGSWSPEKDAWGKRGGRVVQTALAALTLETYYRYLPLFKADSTGGIGLQPVSNRNGSKAGDVVKSVPKKPVETWKPAHVVPNSSRLMVGDKEELPLKGMQVDVRVDGFRARVLIDLYYLNDRAQQLEGNFQLRLPDEASPYFFAFGRTVYQAPQLTAADSMFFKPQEVSQGDTTPEKILALRGNSWEQPKVARMAPREKAALAYRETVRRRIDPALVEWAGAGVFQCRVFPLAPQSLHRVTVGYDVDLLRAGDDLELRLDLPGQAPATIVDLNIAANDPRQVSLEAPLSLRERVRVRAGGEAGNAPATALTPGPSPGGRGEKDTSGPSSGGRGEKDAPGPSAGARGDTSRLSYRLIDPQERPLVVRLRKPGTQMLTGNDEATGSYFATRVGLSLPETVAADRSKQAVFLVDTSLSAGPQFPLWTKLLRATLENNRDSIKEFAVLFFNVETFWWQETFVANTPENVDALMNYADGLALEGATDLGRALEEAAAPKWRKAGTASPSDLFLLSDGAATWGEDRWALLAKPLTPGPSPAKGKGSSALTPGPSPGGRGEKDTSGPTLFAYRTGLAGGDPRLLAYLAEQTGGAVFSLVGEAEIASASVAHRNRPWKLTGIEMAGGRDLLVAGRPQYVFPGQQLLVVGRMEANASQATRQSCSIAFTLQQGMATQTITIKPDQVIASELAARTFGQVATSQLEDVCGASAAAEPVATAYARHFRVTGRTCSLLMLETEQDYARFNIKPEEDSFVVKDRPADALVAKILTEAIAAMGDPKASFLAWYRRVRESSEVHFDLPASLDVALDGLPAETFTVTVPPLQCKLRLRKDLPENLRQPWQSGLPDYETLAAEAERRLTAYGADDALRGLSSLVEDRPGDAALARDLAFSAMQWQRPGAAYHLLRRAGAARTFEPITFHAMAHCLEQMGQADLAIVYYDLACGGQWDGRFGDMHNIAQLDYLRFLRRVADGRQQARLTDYAKARMATLAVVPQANPLDDSNPTLPARRLRDAADLAALIFWNTDGTDVDLHVIEPSGEECFYQHTQTAGGGHISRDVTTGYGPELYLLPAALAGSYRISAHYFAADANRASTRTKVLALIYEGWGTKDEKVTVKALALTGQKENHELATVKR